MKRNTGLLLAVLVFSLTVLAGCIVHHSNVEQADPFMSMHTIPSLHVKEPVALINTSPDSDDIVVCSFMIHKNMGNLKQYTTVSIETINKIFNKENIKTDKELRGALGRKLELSVTKAYCTQHMFKNMDVTIVLSVKAGDGFRQDYTGSDSFATGYQFSNSIERAIALSIEQLLTDPHIVNYLENGSSSMPIVKQPEPQNNSPKEVDVK